MIPCRINQHPKVMKNVNIIVRAANIKQKIRNQILNLTSNVCS
jgi:hypothetical protein